MAELRADRGPAAAPPGAITSDEVRVREESPDGKIKVSIAIEQASHGSGMAFGTARVLPEVEAVSWRFPDDTHEAYYVSDGTLKLTWDGSDPGEQVVGPGEYFYFPPGRTYTIQNAGHEEAFFVWAISPSPQRSDSW